MTDPGTGDVSSTSIAAVICRGNVVGYQFHPEKSGVMGLDLLRRLLALHGVSVRSVPFGSMVEGASGGKREARNAIL